MGRYAARASVLAVASAVAIAVSGCGEAGRHAAQPRGRVVAVILNASGHQLAQVRADDGLSGATRDGRGGWYVSGGFTRIGGVARTGLARLDAAGHVDPVWRPSLGPAPREDFIGANLVRGHGRVYMVGLFGSVDGERRDGAAAVDARSGELDPRWAPTVSSDEPDLALASARVLVTDGNGVAAFGPVSGRRDRRFRLRARPPTEGPTVRELAVAGGRAFVGGSFRRANHVRRQGVARIAPGTGRVLRRWRPPLLDTRPCEGCNGSVAYLTASRRRLYVFGGFHHAGRRRTPGSMVALDARDGHLTRFRAPRPAPDADGDDPYYGPAAVLGGRLFVVGAFGRPHAHGFVLLDARTGRRLPSWHPRRRTQEPDQAVASGNRVLVAGSFGR
jgi:hypothetical protein